MGCHPRVPKDAAAGSHCSGAVESPSRRCRRTGAPGSEGPPPSASIRKGTWGRRRLAALRGSGAPPTSTSGRAWSAGQVELPSARPEVAGEKGTTRSRVAPAAGGAPGATLWRLGVGRRPGRGACRKPSWWPPRAPAVREGPEDTVARATTTAETVRAGGENHGGQLLDPSVLLGHRTRKLKGGPRGRSHSRVQVLVRLTAMVALHRASRVRLRSAQGEPAARYALIALGYGLLAVYMLRIDTRGGAGARRSRGFPPILALNASRPAQGRTWRYLCARGGRSDFAPPYRGETRASSGLVTRAPRAVLRG